MKRSPLRRVTSKQRTELARRSSLKAELMAELPTDAQGRKLCPKCRKQCDFRGFQLSHKKSLSLGGKTDRENCEVVCCPCHYGPKGHRWEGMKKA